MGPPKRSHAPPSQSPAIQISKALSWLLRHGAAKERIAMDPSGYVKVNEVLNWGKMRALKAGFNEVVEVVEENEKQRFGLRYDGDGAYEKGLNREATVVGTETASGELTTTEQSTANDAISQSQPTAASTRQEQTIHQVALGKFHSESSPNPSHYSIRAVQGHSIRTVEAAELHQPITLSDPSSMPAVCVHGTFRSAWPAILKTGGLKAMSRVQVHFANGPRPEDVLPVMDTAPPDETEKEGSGQKSRKLKDAMKKSQVVSGMRPDAELLIYVNVKRSIEGGMEWWRSENGVILTEGMVVTTEPPGPTKEVVKEDVVEDRHSRKQSDGRGKAQKGANGSMMAQKIVPMAYWDSVIEVGLGLGIVWEQGKGISQDFPTEKSREAFGGGGARGGRGRSSRRGPGQWKPVLNAGRTGMDATLGDEEDG